MEVQIPLVLFTSFLAWSAGIFGTQCILALKKKAGEIQLPLLIISVVTLAIGGIAVVFHLTHPTHLFNGFGHLSSGITQELIAIVLVVIVMVLFFLMLRRSEDKTVPAWVAIAGLVVCAVLIVAMGHSYMMESRPAWNNIWQLLSLLGGACVMGPATVAIVAAVKKAELPEIGTFAVIGSAVNAVLAAIFLAVMNAATPTFQSFPYYWDPTHPNYALKHGSDVSIFGADAMTATVLVIVGIVVSVIAAIIGKKQGNKWLTWGSIVLIAGLVCTIALRVLFYCMGETLFMLY